MDEKIEQWKKEFELKMCIRDRIKADDIHQSMNRLLLVRRMAHLV